MKTSILMSVYNGSEYLEEQMESIKNQTVCPNEVVFIDDCSTDNSVVLINEYISRHKLESSWRVIINETNKGWKRNFMEGIKKTHGEVVFFSDQDDIWFSNKVEVYLKVFADSSVNVIISPYVEWYGTSYEICKMSGDYKKIKLNGSFSNFNITGSGCTLAFRKNYYDQVVKYYVEGWAHDDFFRKISQIDNGLAVLNSASILRRFHGNNASKKKRTYESSIDEYEVGIKSMDMLLDYNLMNNIDREKNDKFLKKIKRGYESRYEYFKTKKIKYLFKTVLYNREQYLRLRQIPGDILLVSRKKF